MKQERTYPKIIVTRKAQAALEAGHPWVYDEELINYGELSGRIKNGSLADVVSDKGKYLGTGFISLNSKIRIRIISRNANDRFDEAFYERRVRYAWEYRKTVMAEDIGACRLIFGEADHFPGLTVDRFGDILVTQTLSYGMELIKPLLFPLIYRALTEDGHEIKGIYERNDVAIRELEGLTQNKGWFKLEGLSVPESCLTVIRENGIEYEVDVENGQKTGFFLDQKYNRRAVARIAGGKRVLDCFTNTGSFALNAALGGAKQVCAVDISESAVKAARRNAERNNVKNIEFKKADIFDLLASLDRGGEKCYDFIILDPPAFTKSKKTIESAVRGYKEINYRAMKLLPRGGYLATCSCSHFMREEMFVKMLRAAAADAAVELRQIEARQQSPDHPILWGVPETNYLKFYIFQII